MSVVKVYRATFWFQDFAQLLLKEVLTTIEAIQIQTMPKPIQTNLDGMVGEVMEAQVKTFHMI